MKKKKAELPEDCMPKCATCAFAEINHAEGAGFCHRYPPTFTADDEGAGFTFAGISPIDWCGEYRRKLDA